MMPVELDDETALIRMMRTGCAESFRVLVSRYERRIYRIGYVITKNAEDAEDVLQETLLKAYTSIRRFRGESRLYTWLARIALNEGLTNLRRRTSTAWVSLDEPPASRNAASAPRNIRDGRLNPEDSCSRTEVRGILLKALENLAAPLRVVFTLRYVEGWSCEETGRMLGLSPETVRVRSLRARRRLRRTLSFLFENGALLATR